MVMGGVEIILILGILNLVLILFQVSTGLRWIKVPFQVHKRTGIVLLVCSVFHAFLALLVNYG